VSSTTQRVFQFGAGHADGGADMRDQLGGKGANLAEMARMKIAVPPGFTVSTEACLHTLANDGRLPEGIESEIDCAVEQVEQLTGARFGDPSSPLLFSVRSGARVSMPGMMDTVLDIGIDEATFEGLARKADHRFAFDCYRRFLQMYADVVLGVDKALLGRLVGQATSDGDFAGNLHGGWRTLRDLAGAIRDASGKAVPTAGREQLLGALRAVFASWNTPRAIAYRRIHGIADNWGTAANVMAMVYGNIGPDSGTGVAFSRSPADGQPGLYGEFLFNAQGEDVVAGGRTPGPISEGAGEEFGDVPSFEARLPEVHAELCEIVERLERHFHDVQDVEFTVERGKLWILQTRNAKRAGRAAVRIALDLLDEGTIPDEAGALRLVDARMHVEQLLHAEIEPGCERPAVLATGLAASPGAAAGCVVTDADEAERRAAEGEAVVLVRRETSADDVHGMHAAKGILTATGGLTSHAAVVARGMGVPCVTGAGAVEIAENGSGFRVGNRAVAIGEWITIDGTVGAAYLGRLPVVPADLSPRLDRLLSIADGHRRLGIFANADTVDDARRARSFGAEGIGLCRTEHMFFGTDERLVTVRALILAETDAERDAALARLLPLQRADFEALLREMDGRPVTIRLLDPPLHEFLPDDADGFAALGAHLGRAADAVAEAVTRMRERNPMLGFRGCRIGIVHEAIYRMQAEAILEASLALRAEGLDPHPEIMVPLVAVPEELAYVRAYIEETAASLFDEHRARVDYKIGTMIELPRAALAAGEIAAHADFFSFGTNDLTQTTFGLSRDDAARFLPLYESKHIVAHNPFASLDEEGVGELIRIAIERGRATKPGLTMGICGEHGGDPRSIAFCHRAGLDYVSCSPYRVPGARLAAAQAATSSGIRESS